MFGFFKRLFADSKKRVMNHASGLAQVAQIVVDMAVMNHIKAKNPTMDENSQYQVAAAWANYLFGKEPSESHAHLDLNAEHAKAVRWLENEGEVFQDLVIQGLRLNNIAAYARTGNANISGNELLEKFGKQHPDAPDLEEYSASLFLTIVGQLEPIEQGDIFNYIRTGPFASSFKNSKHFGWD